MPSFTTEYEAISQLRTGNISAFNFLYDKYFQAVYGNIYKFVKNQSLAEDLLQDVFISLWEHRASIKTDVAVGGWLFVVSYNKAMALLKRQVREATVLKEAQIVKSYDALEQTMDESDFKNMLDLVEEAINLLPKKKQEVFRLCKYEHKKPEEISQELGLTVISVKDYLKQSNKLIKNYIRLKYTVEATV